MKTSFKLENASNKINIFVIKPKIPMKTSFKLENASKKSIYLLLNRLKLVLILKTFPENQYLFLLHFMKGGTIMHFFDKNVEILLTGMCKGFCHKKSF